MMYENDYHIRVRCLDQNAGESAVQSMDDVKDDPCVGFLLVAHGCHILSRTNMTNSLSVAHSDVDISRVEPLHHFPRDILEEFDLVGAIPRRNSDHAVPWNAHLCGLLSIEHRGHARHECAPLIDIGRYVSRQCQAVALFAAPPEDASRIISA